MPARTYHLTSVRLGLSRWTGNDLPLAQSLWGDSAVMHLLGGALSDAAVKSRLSLEIALDRAYGVQYWPVFLRDRESVSLEVAGHERNTSAEFIGCAGLRPFPYPHPDPHTYELGAHLLPAFWRSGFAAEAGHAILRHAFDTLNAYAIHTGHHPKNDASRKVIAASRFRYLAHRFYPPTSLLHPYYRLTAEEYRGGLTPQTDIRADL